MRKIFKSFMLVAAAAMTFASCQREELNAPKETVSATLTMHAGVEQTKTYLNGNAVLWGTGEAVALYVGTGVGDNATAMFVSSDPTDIHNGAKTASFTFTLEGVPAEGPYSLGGIYPASAAMEDNKDPKKCKTILPQIQNAEVGKYDPSAYIMVLKPETVETLPSEYQASFRRATALNKITLTNVKEDITTVEITVPEGQALAGRRYFDLTDGTSGEIYYGQSNTITVNAPFTGSTIDVWFCSWGAELAAGDEMTIRMKNANKSFTRTIVAREDGIKFVEGDLNKLTVDMASAEEESFDSFAGEWLITGTSGSVIYAAGAYVSGKNNLNNNIAITIENDVIEPVDGLENCKMLFTKVTEGEYKGMYTIQDANGNYLCAAASSSNHLKATATANTAHYYWAVEFNDGKYSVVASKSSYRNVMQFNPNNGSPIFACYASASQTAVVLYPYSMVKVDTTPKIVVRGETTKDVVFGGETVTFNYELKYLEGEDLTWEVSDSEIITDVAAEDGVLSVTVAENTGEARTATITLSCGDAEPVVLTINQAEYVDASVIKEITVADFLSKSVDANVWYQLTGTIKEIKNTTYGNFYLEDETGYVYVYGLTETQVSSNDKSFESIGLREGDTVTLIGTRAQYASASVADQKEQVGGPAYYVSHVAAPYVELTMESASVDAETTSYTVEIKSNSNWTASASTDVTLDQTSGNGDASIKMTFAENTTSDAVTHTLTVAVEGSTKTFTLTQKGVVSGDGNEPVVVFSESFSNSTGSMGWSNNAGNGTFATDNTGWTVENAYGADGSAKFGTSKKLGKATTPALNITGNATLKFKAGAWTGDQTNLKLSMSGGTLSVTSVTLKNATWTEYEVTITNATSGAKVTFEGKQASKARFFLDDIEIIQN